MDYLSQKQTKQLISYLIDSRPKTQVKVTFPEYFTVKKEEDKYKNIRDILYSV
jgi:hypothetical protein